MSFPTSSLEEFTKYLIICSILCLIITIIIGGGIELLIWLISSIYTMR